MKIDYPQHVKYELKKQELFEEYRNSWIDINKLYEENKHEEAAKLETKTELIIQEVEALVRKETIEEMLNDPRHSESDEWVVHTKLIEWVKGWALSKGVKLD